MAKERRMLWIRNLDEVSSAASTYTVEAEFASEAHVCGQLTYSNGTIVCGPTTMRPDSQGLYKYLLRLRMPAFEGIRDEPRRSPTKQGYVFRAGPIGELLALFSVKLQARMFLLSTSTQFSANGLPLKTEYYPTRGLVGPALDPVVFSPDDRNFVTDVEPFLDELRRLPPARHHQVAVAASHYARALREVGVDEEMVFVRLVSAIEKLSTDQHIPSDPLSDVDLERFVRPEALQPSQLEELRQLLRTRRAKARFVAFIDHHAASFLDGLPTEPQHTQVTVDRLPAIAAAIYDARSGYLHAGDPMYLSRYIADFPDWHMDPSVGMTIQDRSFTEHQKLPRSDFFHRLVRHCLLKYVVQEVAG
jgi:hypothetical protein